MKKEKKHVDLKKYDLVNVKTMPSPAILPSVMQIRLFVAPRISTLNRGNQEICGWMEDVGGWMHG
jgi:hypothetical protein